MNDMKRDLIRIQELVGMAFSETGSLVALADGGQMSPNKLQKTLEKTMEQFERTTLELRRLCERYSPGAGGFAHRPALPYMDITGSVETFGYGWLHITLHTLLPHCRYQTPNWLSDTIRCLLDEYETCGKKLPFYSRAMLVIDEHTGIEGRHIYDQDNKGWKAISNAIKGRLIPDDDQHSTGLRAAGSNGMCIVTAKGDDQSTGDISLLVPALSLGKLAGMCKDEDEFRVGTTGKSIVFFKENFLFSARLIEGGYIDTDSLLKTITNSFTVLTDTKEMREALSSVLSVALDGRVNLAFEDQKLVFHCSSDWGNASAGIDVIALTGAPTGSYWYSAKQLATCLKALGGTITLGIAQSGMLTISTQDAYYLQNVMRAPTAKKKSKKAIEPPAAKAA